MSTDALALSLVRNHPRDAARAVAQLQATELAPFLFRLPPADAAGLLRLLSPLHAAQCLSLLEPDAAARIVERMGTDIAAVLLRRLDNEQRHAVLAAMRAARSAALRLALRYSEAVVGSVLDADVLAVTANARVSEVLQTVQQRGDLLDNNLYVINDRQRLVGVVEIRRLLTADTAARMSELMQPADVVFSARASLVTVRNDPVWARIAIAPVVDHNGVLLGVIARDAIDVAVSGDSRHHSEDAFGAMFSFAESLWSAFIELFVRDDSGARKGGGR